MDTFVLRLWSGEEEAPGMIRGVLEHPVTGRSTAFVGEDELLSLLRDAQQRHLGVGGPRERG